MKSGHAGLNVTDIDRSIAFYRAGLGLELLETGESEGRRWAYLVGDQGLMITLWQQASGSFSAEHSGLHHLALLVDSVAEVEAVHATLVHAGALVRHGGVVPHGPGEESGGLFFEDPDGIRLEVYAEAGTGAGGAMAPYGEAPTCGFF